MGEELEEDRQKNYQRYEVDEAKVQRGNYECYNYNYLGSRFGRTLKDFIINTPYYLLTTVFTLLSWNYFELSPLQTTTPIDWKIVADREIRSEP